MAIAVRRMTIAARHLTIAVSRMTVGHVAIASMTICLGRKIGATRDVNLVSAASFTVEHGSLAMNRGFGANTVGGRCHGVAKQPVIGICGEPGICLEGGAEPFFNHGERPSQEGFAASKS